jgi:hypothetical protein
MREVSLRDPEIVALFEKKLVLVRPDGHVCWRGDSVPAQPSAIIDCVRGAADTARNGAPACRRTRLDA